MDPTPTQSVVSAFLARAYLDQPPQSRPSFMRACLIALRQHQVPTRLVSRRVSVSPWNNDSPRQALVLLVEGRPIGVTGEVGWKAIYDRLASSVRKGSVVQFTQSADKATLHDPARFHGSASVQALLPQVQAELAAALLKDRAPIVDRERTRPIRL